MDPDPVVLLETALLFFQRVSTLCFSHSNCCVSLCFAAKKNISIIHNMMDLRHIFFHFHASESNCSSISACHFTNLHYRYKLLAFCPSEIILLKFCQKQFCNKIKSDLLQNISYIEVTGLL